MSHSLGLPRKRPGRASRPSRGRNRPQQRSHMPVTRFALLVTAACGSIATGAYFAFHDDVFARLIGRQTEMQITYENQIADLRAQLDHVASQQVLDKERVEQQVKTLLQRQATFEQPASAFANDLSTQNGWPASGTIKSPPLLSPIEKPSAPIVAILNAESAKQAEQAVTVDKKVRRPHRKHARVIRKRTQEAPTIAAGHNVSAEPAGQQNY